MMSPRGVRGDIIYAAKTREPRKPYILIALVLVLVFFSLVHMCAGARMVPLHSIWESLFRFDQYDFEHQIIVSIRAPRMLAALLSGAALGLAGAALQAITKNPLVGPGITGMTSGGAMFVVLASLYISAPVIDMFLPYLAALGAFSAFLLVLLISGFGRSKKSTEKVVVVGIMVSAFFSAVTTVILLINQKTFDVLRLWLAGNLAGKSMNDIEIAFAQIVIGSTILVIFIRQIDTLMLGQNTAKALGVSIKFCFFVVLMSSAFLVSGSIICAGPVAFIGLIAPNLAKLIDTSRSPWVFPLSAVIGSILLVGCDIVARLIISPIEIATGLVVGCIGSLFFLLLIKVYCK